MTDAQSERTSAGVLILRGPVTRAASDRFLRSLEILSSQRINVVVDSPGGSVLAGLDIWRALVCHPARITVEVEGRADSIASLISMAGEEIVFGESSSMMLHRPWSDDLDDLALWKSGVAPKVEGVLGAVTGFMASVYAARSGASVEEARGWMDSQLRFDAAAAIRVGLCDRVRYRPGRTGVGSLARLRRSLRELQEVAGSLRSRMAENLAATAAALHEE